MTNHKRKILVTSALPYANGPIHIGHLVEYVQTDIWVRFQRLCGHQVFYIGADDAHGTPIMIKAENENITPEQLIAQIKLNHKRDFDGFHISFDNYHSTHSPENKFFSEQIYERCATNGNIKKRTIQQAFDEVKQMFLPDRLIRGTCPNCKADDQYGDSCEHCGSTYSPTDLINPRSALSDSPTTLRESEHYFFDLPAYQTFLEEWTGQPKRLQKEMLNKLDEWFQSGLQQWDISRDPPYFGFVIPNTSNQKFFYVWLDAPIGYIASFKNYCTNNPQKNLDFDDWWNKDSTTELHHFIGKDIVYFHALFWPAVLKASDFRLPTQIHAHGFLTVNGQKMSKSRGTFISAETWLKHLDPEPLRYIFASRLNSKVEDLDLDLNEFEQKFNGDVIGKVVNIASRCSGFLAKFFANQLGELDDETTPLVTRCLSLQDTIATHYEDKNYASALREIMLIADHINHFINHHQPWKLAKQINQADTTEPQKLASLHAILSACIHGFYCLIIYLQPILPSLARKSQHYLNVKTLRWNDLHQPILPNNHQVNKFEPLIERLEKENIVAMVESEKT